MRFPPAPTLFVSQFAAQAAFLAPVPVLPAIAGDLGVSVAAAGQLRTISGAAAALTALGAGALARRLGIRRMLLLGLALIAAGAAASAAAPSFLLLAAAQPAVGAGMATVLAGGWSAAAAWVPPAGRARLLGWTIVGQPAAWVVGMPVIGLVTAGSWRWAWIALPLAAAVLAGAGVASRRPDGPPPVRAAGTRRHPEGVGAWALGELLTYAAWGAVLVYAGAFFIEAQHVSARDAGLLLGAAASGFLPGTLLTRRWAEAHMRAMLLGFGLAAAGTVVLLDTLPLPTAGRTLLLGVLMFAIGARTMAAGAFGLHETPDRRAAAMGIRAAAMQLGNLAGAAAGGAAIATGGFPALGVLAGGLFALGAAPHLLPRRPALAGRVLPAPAPA
jgi:predicted MFS family arabinose efflux permease